MEPSLLKTAPNPSACGQNLLPEYPQITQTPTTPPLVAPEFRTARPDKPTLPESGIKPARDCRPGRMPPLQNNTESDSHRTQDADPHGSTHRAANGS